MKTFMQLLIRHLPLLTFFTKTEGFFSLCDEVCTSSDNMSCQEYLLRGVYTTISTVCRQRVLHIEGGSNLAYSIDSSMFRSGSDSEVQV